MLVWLTSRVDRRLAETIFVLHERGVSQAVFRQFASESSQKIRKTGINVAWLPLNAKRCREAAMRLAGKYSGVSNVIFHAIGVEATSAAVMATKICRFLSAVVVSEFDPGQRGAWWHRYMHAGYYSSAIVNLIVREPLRSKNFHNEEAASIIPVEKIHFLRFGFDCARHAEQRMVDASVFKVGISVNGFNNTQLRALLGMLNWVSGDYEFEFVLFGHANTLAAAERISHRFTGKVSALIKYVGCDEITPYHWVGCNASIHTLLQPNAGAELIDALACGAVPIVKSDKPCDPVRDGQTGFVIAPDNPVSLKQTLELLASHPPMRNEIVTAGRQLVEEFYGLEDTVAHLCDIYGPGIYKTNPMIEKEMSVGVGH